MTLVPPRTPGSLIERAIRWWRIRNALRDLQHLTRHAAAEESLIAASPHSWPGLRKIAFKERGSRAVSAAHLLVQLGDRQGLFALLEQYSSPEVRGEAGALLDKTLRQIGPQHIEAALTDSIRSLQRQALGSGAPALAISVYALRVLEDFRQPLSPSLLSQAIMVTHPQFDPLATTRAVFPFTAFTDFRTGQTEVINDFYIGSSLAPVRRAAVDFLISQEGAQAFALLSEAMAHPDPHVQYAALYGLSRLREERALPLFQRIASNRKHPLAHDAQRAIEVFGTRLPDILTLVRGSQPSAPEDLLRPASGVEEIAPETLLRATSLSEHPPSS